MEDRVLCLGPVLALFDQAVERRESTKYRELRILAIFPGLAPLPPTLRVPFRFNLVWD